MRMLELRLLILAVRLLAPVELPQRVLPVFPTRVVPPVRTVHSAAPQRREALQVQGRLAPQVHRRTQQERLRVQRRRLVAVRRAVQQVRRVLQLVPRMRRVRLAAERLRAAVAQREAPLPGMRGTPATQGTPATLAQHPRTLVLRTRTLEVLRPN